EAERGLGGPGGRGERGVRPCAAPDEGERDEAEDDERDREHRDVRARRAHTGIAPSPGRSGKTNRPRSTVTARKGSSLTSRLPSRSAHSTAGARCAAAAIATLVSAARQPSITPSPRSW